MDRDPHGARLHQDGVFVKVRAEMKVHKINLGIGAPASFTVLTDAYEVVAPAERYLAHLSNIGRSPNTVRCYAYALASWFAFLHDSGAAWDGPDILERLGRYVDYLQLSRSEFPVLSSSKKRTRRTINLYIAGIYGLYTFHSRNGVNVLKTLITVESGRHRSYKPFLHGLAPSAITRHLVHLPEPKRIVTALSLEQAVSVVRVQRRLRNRFLFALLLLTGMRIGQALGLRHSDFISRRKVVRLVARDDNANHARAKAPIGEILGETPISDELVTLYSEYMHVEYGDFDSDYVFINLWSGPIGKPMSYSAVVKLVKQTSSIVGFHFTPHQFRHTFATLHRNAGVPIDIISRLLNHKSVTTTTDIYSHPDVEVVRQKLTDAGVLSTLIEGKQQ